MLRMPRWRLCLALMLLESLATSTGCSEKSTGTIDPKVVIEKATGGDNKARIPGKAKAASEEAAKKHPKLY